MPVFVAWKEKLSYYCKFSVPDCRKQGQFYPSVPSPCTAMDYMIESPYNSSSMNWYLSTYRSDPLEKLVVLFVEGKSEGAVDDPPVDVGAEVNLADVVVLEDRLVAGVGRVMGRAVVDGAPSGKCKAGVQSVLADHLPGNALQPLANVDHLHAGLHPRPEVHPSRSVGLGRLPDVAVHFLFTYTDKLLEHVV